MLKNKSYLFLLCLLVFAALLNGCGSGDLTRSKAQSLIEGSNQFKQISTLSVVTPTEESMKQRGGNIMKRTSADDTPEEAMKRALKYYFEFNTDVGLAQHLDYISVQQKFVKEQPRNPSMPFGSYKVKSTTRTNEKGKALWDEVEKADAEGFDKETSLPLAKKRNCRNNRHQPAE